MSIRHWPQNERPREKLIQSGAQSLTDAELLAIFLRTGIKGQSAVDLARQLILEFGSLAALMGASREQFCQAKGLGDAKFAQLQSVMEMAKRYFASELQKPISASSSQTVKAYVASQMRGLSREAFAVLCLDSQFQLIHFETLFWGTINSTEVHPREVVKLALQHNANALILTHNHPSGVTTPSAADIQITQQLQQALSLVDIQILDHLIVGGHEVSSMAELGLMDKAY